MALFLEIISGEQSGSRIRLKNGLVIGRREGDLTIQDSKLSSRHAQVLEALDGRFRLVDLGSTNGIKTADGTRVRELELEEGLSFILGRTKFRIVTGSDEFTDFDEITVPMDVVDEENTPSAWDLVQELVDKALRKIKSEGAPGQREVTAFTPIIRLKFTRGIQMGAEWTVGYGPRMIGTSSIDLHLQDPSLPPLCFRLLPENGGRAVRFKNESEKEVRLNGIWVDSQILKDGDVIDIGTTQIRVTFDEGSN